MAQKAHGSTDPDIIASFKALRRAARKARELGLRTGTPVWVMIRGRIVDITKRKPKRKAVRPRAK
ncbi:MAG: hypothetical protein AB1714_10220 [Acidobacteriota bacterium]